MILKQNCFQMTAFKKDTIVSFAFNLNFIRPYFDLENGKNNGQLAISRQTRILYCYFPVQRPAFGLKIGLDHDQPIHIHFPILFRSSVLLALWC